MMTTAEAKLANYAANLTDQQILTAHAKLNRSDQTQRIAAEALSDELIHRHNLDPAIDQIIDGDFNGTWHELLVLVMGKVAA